MDFSTLLPLKGSEHPIYPTHAQATHEASALPESEPAVVAVCICSPNQMTFASAPVGQRIAIFRAIDMKPGDFLIVQRNRR